MSTVLVYGPYHALVLTRRFLHEYELIAGLHGLSADAMRERDAAAPPLGRWYSIEGGAVVGLATARRRPDHRTFLRFAVLDPRAYEPLVRAADAGFAVL